MPEKNREITVQELRRFTALSESLFRAMASRVGMAVTDIQVVEILDSSGPAAPGDLAELTGLTSGAIAGILNRLEETGLLRRERDPADGRRVIVRLDAESDKMKEIHSAFNLLRHAWNEVVKGFDEAQTALIADFLRRNSAMARVEMARLRDGVAEGEAFVSASLEGVSRGQLTVTGATELSIIVDRSLPDLFRATFEGAAPDVKTGEGAVSIRYPRKLSNLFGAQRTATVTLGAAVPWQISVQGGGAIVKAELAGLNLAGFEAATGASMVTLALPTPTDVVPVRLSGGASVIAVKRPAGVAVRTHLKGSSNHLVFDEKSYATAGKDLWMQSIDYDPAGPHYTIEVASSASSVTISST